MFIKIIKLITASAMFAVLAFSAVSPVAFADTPALNGQNRRQQLPDVCAGKCPVTNAVPTNPQQIVSIILQIAQFLTYIAVALAVLVIVYGGYLYMNPTGKDGDAAGKKVLVNASIGLVIAITAVTIVTVVKGLVTGTYF